MQRIELAAPEVGVMAEILVKEGTMVKAGQVVARLDDQVYQNAMLVAKAASEAQGTLEAAKIHTKEKVCDVVGDITTSSSAVATAAKKEEKNPLISEATDEAQSKANSTVRIVSNAVTEEDRPAGTTWVFSDGSQVMASSSKLDESLNEEEDKEGTSLLCVRVLSCKFFMLVII